MIGRGIKYAVQSSVHERRRYLYQKQSSMDLRREMLEQLVITPEVVASKSNNMKENKSPGVDAISPKILKETLEQISTPLAHVFNMMQHAQSHQQIRHAPTHE